MLGQALPLLLDIIGSSDAQFQRCRLQSGQNLLSNELVEDTASKALAARATARLLLARAFVPQVLRSAAVMNDHAPAAASTDQQTSQKRCTFPWGAECFV